MEEIRPPVRCPRCNGQPNWQEHRVTQRERDTVGRLGEHPIIGWRCNLCQYFLPVSQWES